MSKDNALRIVAGQINPRSLGSALMNSDAIALAGIRHGRIVFANPAFHARFRATEPLTNACLKDVLVDIPEARLNAALAEVALVPNTWVRVSGNAGERTIGLALSLESTILDGEPTVIACVSRDPEQQHTTERLAWLAYSDALTGLSNRPLFMDHLHRALREARQRKAMFAVLMLDLDGFKAVNDTHGHDAGDAALQLVAQRLQGCVRHTDTLARLGGDEFAILMLHLTDDQSAAVLALRLVDALREKLDLGTHQVEVGASVGIALYPRHAVSADGLLVAADTALFRAKRAGKNQFQWATTSLDTADSASSPSPTWNHVYSVGIQEIDEQHAHMAKLIDGISATLRDGADGPETLTNVRGLISYTAFHFASEERLMAHHQISHLMRHANAHRRLLEDLETLDTNADTASISLTLSYLREWLLRHIISADKELGRALHAKGCR